MTRVRKAVLAGLVLMAAATAVLFFSISNWLQSTGGRELLQNSLSRSIGANVEILGGYELRMFPTLRVKGSSLQLTLDGGATSLASVADFSIQLALRPLLERQLQIIYLELGNAVLDLAYLSSLVQSRDVEETESSAGDSSLPEIKSLVVTDLTLLQRGIERLVVHRLQLEDFKPGKDAFFQLRLAMPAGQSPSPMLSLSGSVQWEGSFSSVGLELSEISLMNGDQEWNLGHGTVAWLSNKGTSDSPKIEAELENTYQGFAGQWNIDVLLEPELEVALNGAVHWPDDRMARLDAGLQQQIDHWRLDPMVLDFDGQALSGSGCLYLEPATDLNLFLEAETLDLDRLKTLWPADLNTSPGGEGGTPELPLQLAVRLQIQQARMEGAVAREVELQIGNKPECERDQSSDQN